MHRGHDLSHLTPEELREMFATTAGGGADSKAAREEMIRRESEVMGQQDAIILAT
jgi:hypothetical protein